MDSHSNSSPVDTSTGVSVNEDDRKNVDVSVSGAGTAEQVEIKTYSRLNNEKIEEFRMISGLEAAEIIRLEKEFLRMTGNSDFMSRDVFLKIPAIAVCPLWDRVEMIFFEGSSVSANDVDTCSTSHLLRNEMRRTGSGSESFASYFSSWLDSVSWLLGSPPQEGSDTRTALPSSVDGTALDTDRQISSLKSAGRDVVITAANCRDHINFRDFLLGLSLFNSPGMAEMKLKMSFRLQDFDDDGVLSREDLEEYLARITGVRPPPPRPGEETKVETEGGELVAKDKEGVSPETGNGTPEGEAESGEKPAEDNEDSSEKEPAPARLGLSEDDIAEVVDQLFLECVDTGRAVGPGRVHGIVVSDYIRIVAQSEFLTKLRITI